MTGLGVERQEHPLGRFVDRIRGGESADVAVLLMRRASDRQYQNIGHEKVMSSVQMQKVKANGEVSTRRGNSARRPYASAPASTQFRGPFIQACRSCSDRGAINSQPQHQREASAF